MSLFFEARSRLRWEGRSHREGPLGEDELPPRGRRRALYDRYGLGRWSGSLGRGSLDEILGTLDLLDRLPTSVAPAGATLLDVGSKNGRALPALSAWLERTTGKPGRVLGVEVDAYRLYANLTSRASVARHLCNALGGRVEYAATDVRDTVGSFGAVTCLFPFLQLRPHRAWGLPGRLFGPDAVLRASLRRVAPGGPLIVANFGNWEWEAAQALLEARAGLLWLEWVRDGLHASQHPVALSVWEPAY